MIRTPQDPIRTKLGRTRRWLACLWLFCLGLSLPLQIAQASGPNEDSVSVLYCIDGHDAVTLEQARRCDYGAYAAMSMSTRYAAVRWVKVQTQTTKESQVLTIGVAPNLMREIEIFDGRSGELIAGPVGTSHPFSGEHGLLAGYTFAIDVPGPASQTYFVRMVTYGVPYGYVSASFDAATAQDIHQRVGLGIHLGVLGLLTLISLSLYGATRNRVMGAFALNIVNLLVTVLVGSGLLFMYLWPQWPQFNETLFNTMLYLKPGLWVLLAQTFLAPYATPRWYHPSCRAAYLLVAGMLVLSWMGLGHISVWLMLIFGATVFPIVQLIAIAATQNMRRVYQRILMFGYAFGVIAIWLALVLTFYPTDRPDLPIQLTRIIDYINPVVLLALVMFYYRETLMQLEAAKQDNLAMQLGLAFEQKLKEERKLMIDMLTHELKNPLASISLANGSLSRTLKDSDDLIARRLQNIDRSVRSMDAVIERCNLMNQLDQSTLTSHAERIDLLEAFEEVTERLDDPARVSLKIEGRSSFSSDPQFFQMVVSNLIDNALKYSPSTSVVNISVKGDANDAAAGLVIEVRNEIGSKGRPDQASVFKRFYRHPLAQNTSGSGVGLYLVQALVKLMGGHIDYLPTHEHVVFRITLPQASPDD